MHPRLRALLLALPVLIAACRGGATEITVAAAPRTVESMLPKLSRSLTPSSAETLFGRPDETTGSGLLIYVYHVESGKNVLLGFPGFAPILYAAVRDSSGTIEQLSLRD